MRTLDLAQTMRQLQATATFDELRDVLSDGATRLGFPYFVILQSDSSGTDVGGIFVTNYPEAYIEHQAQTFAYRHNPILALARSASTPFMWSDLPRIMALTPEQRDYMTERSNAGLGNGLTAPVHTPGEPSGFVSLATTTAEPYAPELVAAATYVATNAYAEARRIRGTPSPRGTSQALDENDRLIIKLVAQGKSRWRIAQKLDVSERSVTASLLRARRYYRVGTHTQAIVRALYDRTIHFEDVIG